jgi:hypothetical protein
MGKFLLVLFLSLFLAGSVVSDMGVLGQGQDVYSLQLQGFTWNHSTIAALVVTADNESWWNPRYTNATLRAIGQWNDAIADFAAGQSGFAYLSGVMIQTTVSDEMKFGFDLYVNWTESPLSDTSDEIGLARTIVNGDGTIENCSISLAAHTNHGIPLDEVDMQNIALHELGHGLGLGHSNHTDDLMYSFYSVGEAGEAVSTLDVYGVAVVFGWKADPESFYPVSGWLTESTVALPSDVGYEGLPVSPENAPPQTLTNNPVVKFFVSVFELLLHPEIAAIVIVFFAVVIVVGLAVRRRGNGAVTAGS